MTAHWTYVIVDHDRRSTRVVTNGQLAWDAARMGKTVVTVATVPPIMLAPLPPTEPLIDADKTAEALAHPRTLDWS